MRQLILDSNLLVLLVVGTAGPGLITRHKRLSAYRAADFDTLRHDVAQFDGILILPNIATESANLLSQTDRPTARLLRARLRDIVLANPERYVPTQQAVGRLEYLRLGLSDAAILAALRTGVLPADS